MTDDSSLIDYPASPAFWGSDRLYEAFRSVSPPEQGGDIIECAYCDKVVWREPDGSKSEFTLRPITDIAGHVIRVEGLGAVRTPHICIDRALPPPNAPVQTWPAAPQEPPNGIASRPEYQGEM